MVEGRFAELIAGQRQGVLVTLRKDGRPQLSNVNYAWYPEEQTIRVSTTDDRAKIGNMRSIREQAERLVELDARLRPFADRLRSMAERFESRAILALIERYRLP